MRNIYPPTPQRHATRDCADALEPAFAQIIDRAEMAGWARAEALHALCMLTLRFRQGESSAAPDTGSVNGLFQLSGQ